MPYHSSQENLLKMLKVESPMLKIELIYKGCTSSIQKDIEHFWKNYEINPSRLIIDVDNLQGILIYIISRLKNPTLIADLHLIEDYIPSGVKKSNRLFYLMLMKAACEYLGE